jgi:hypothetical protein
MGSATNDRPMCQVCKHRMVLARISPGERGLDERTFECATQAAALTARRGWSLLVAALSAVFDDHLADVRLVDAVGLVALAGCARPAHAAKNGIPRSVGMVLAHQPMLLQIGQFGFTPSTDL